MRLEVNAAVVLVRSVLRDNLDLRATIATVFRVVVVREDFDFLDRILVGRDHGRPAPGDAGGSDAVDLIIVFPSAGAVGGDLTTVFNLEWTIRATSAANRGAGQVLCAAARTLCAVTKSSRSQLQKLESVAAERWQPLDFLAGHGALEVRGLRINQWSRIAVYCDGLIDGSYLELEINSVRLLGDYAHVLENFLLKAGLFHCEGVLARRKATKVVDAIFICRGRRDLARLMIC